MTFLFNYSFPSLSFYDVRRLPLFDVRRLLFDFPVFATLWIPFIQVSWTNNLFLAAPDRVKPLKINPFNTMKFDVSDGVTNLNIEFNRRGPALKPGIRPFNHKGTDCI